MDRTTRKTAKAAWKERDPVRGVFAVTSGDGRCWIGASPALDRSMNGLWFTLRLGSHPCVSLQCAWTEQGEAAFSFRELERLDADIPDLAVGSRLAELRDAWVQRLDGLRL